MHEIVDTLTALNSMGSKSTKESGEKVPFRLNGLISLTQLSQTNI